MSSPSRARGYQVDSIAALGRDEGYEGDDSDDAVGGDPRHQDTDVRPTCATHAVRPIDVCFYMCSLFLMMSTQRYWHIGTTGQRACQLVNQKTMAQSCKRFTRPMGQNMTRPQIHTRPRLARMVLLVQQPQLLARLQMTALSKATHDCVLLVARELVRHCTVRKVSIHEAEKTCLRYILFYQEPCLLVLVCACEGVAGEAVYDQLLGMGFPERKCEGAAMMYPRDFQRALDYMLAVLMDDDAPQSTLPPPSHMTDAAGFKMSANPLFAPGAHRSVRADDMRLEDVDAGDGHVFQGGASGARLLRASQVKQLFEGSMTFANRKVMLRIFQYGINYGMRVEAHDRITDRKNTIHLETEDVQAACRVSGCVLLVRVTSWIIHMLV